jgi:hypothetical protein
VAIEVGVLLAKIPALAEVMAVVGGDHEHRALPEQELIQLVK